MKRKSGKIQMLITYVTSKCVFETVGSHPNTYIHHRYKHYWPLSWNIARSAHTRYQEVELQNVEKSETQKKKKKRNNHTNNLLVLNIENTLL